MKSIKLLIFLLLAGLCACQEKLEERVLLKHPNNTPAVIEYYYAQDSTKSTVKFVRYYINGEKQEETYMQNGMKQGKSTVWHLNGKKLYEAFYKDDMPHGLFTQWTAEGKKDYEAEYDMGRPIGTWKFYNTDGSLKSEQSFN